MLMENRFYLSEVDILVLWRVIFYPLILQSYKTKWEVVAPLFSSTT